MSDKYFDRREAEELSRKLIPRLEEARSEKQKIDSFREDLSQAASRIMVMGGSFPPFGELLKKKTAHDEATSRVMEIVNEIQETGCVVKDLDEGLVDFPSLIEGEEVYLCWKLGEEHIAFWHGMDEGFASRKPLDEPGSSGTPPQGPRLQ
jgi:hypothetical protein